eukprot:m.143368 g.143368  ORF g.143368 m.143368 type:complete len:239 (-) comp14091_c0_seq1:636-1352(-)
MAARAASPPLPELVEEELMPGVYIVKTKAKAAAEQQAETKANATITGADREASKSKGKETAATATTTEPSQDATGAKVVSSDSGEMVENDLSLGSIQKIFNKTVTGVAEAARTAEQPLSLLVDVEVARLQNSLVHLYRSNDEMGELADEDEDLKQYIEENHVVIKQQAVRIKGLKMLRTGEPLDSVVGKFEELWLEATALSTAQPSMESTSQPPSTSSMQPSTSPVPVDSSTTELHYL